MFYNLYDNINPFPQEELMRQLTKQVEIYNFTWGSSSTAVTNFDPILQMLNVSPWLQSILGQPGVNGGMYRYFRSNVKITIKLNTTPYHQGSLVVSWVPYPLSTSFLLNVYSACQLHNVILSASKQDECSLELPYFSQDPHMDMLNYTGIWRVGFVILNNLITSSPSVSDTVYVSVFSQFVNPTVYGPIPTMIPTTKAKPPCEPLIYKQQMSERGNFPPGMNGMALAAQVDSLKNTPTPEADATNKSVTATGGKKTLGQAIVPILKCIPFIAPFVDLGFWLFDNLDKPLSSSGHQFFIKRPMRCVNTLTGTSHCEYMSSLPQAAVAKDVGVESSDMAVVQYAQLPSLYQQYTITASGYIGRLLNHPQIFSSTYADYLAFASSMYVYWRGSIKYAFYFVGTAFYSVRIRISLMHVAWPTSPGSLTDPTPIYQRILDVKGDTWTEFTVPFLTPYARLPTSINSSLTKNYTYIWIEALTPVLGSNLPADALYYLNVFRAAGPDFQLAQLRTAQIASNTLKDTFTDTLTYRQQTSLRNKFAQPFDGIVPGICGNVTTGIHMADTATTISDACHRFVDQVNYMGQLHFTYPGESDPSTLYQPFHFWSFGFAFWRGSRRYIGYNGGNVQNFYLYDSFNNLARSDTQGSAKVYPDDIQTTAAEIPYYSPQAYYMTPWNGNTPPESYFFQPTDAAAIPGGTAWTGFLLASGDDFRYIYPIPYLGQVSALQAELEQSKKTSTSTHTITGGKDTLDSVTTQSLKTHHKHKT